MAKCITHKISAGCRAELSRVLNTTTRPRNLPHSPHPPRSRRCCRQPYLIGINRSLEFVPRASLPRFGPAPGIAFPSDSDRSIDRIWVIRVGGTSRGITRTLACRKKTRTSRIEDPLITHGDSSGCE
ncbi:hypothetical protein PUN28_002923 [Cardiocondyla obscurior]|uniref:Uncharacterized protein n=1 Tax=Cardiocondyla obscurior TaxID=286306 RepID=A0AAW2GWP6_9HYME